MTKSITRRLGLERLENRVPLAGLPGSATPVITPFEDIQQHGRIAFLASDDVTLVDMSDPSSPSFVSEIDVPGIAIQLHAANNRLTVASRESVDGQRSAWLSMYDVSRASHPALMGEYQVVGDLIDARMVGSTFHVVTTEVVFVVSASSVDSLPLSAKHSGASQVVWGNRSLYLFARRGASTAIQQFTLETEARKEPTLVAEGVIKGIVADETSVDEFQDHLRVLTSQKDNSARSDLFVLQDDAEGNLRHVGSLLDFASNRVTAVRFLEGHVYVASSDFKGEHHLHVIDLAEAANPTLARTIRLPTTTQYLLATGDDLLLAFAAAGSRGIFVYTLQEADSPREIGRTESLGSGRFAPETLSYSPDSGLFAVGIDDRNRAIDAFPLATRTSHFAFFKIDRSSQEVIEQLGATAHSGTGHTAWIRGSSLLGEYWLSYSHTALKVDEVRNSVHAIGDFPLRLLREDHLNFRLLGKDTRIDVLMNDRLDDKAQIIGVTRPRQGTTTLAADGRAILYSPPTGFSGSLSEHFLYTVRAGDGRIETAPVYLTSGRFSNATFAVSLLHNSRWPADTNNDGSVSRVDATLLIDELNAHGARQFARSDVDDVGQASSAYWDVNNDGWLSPSDVLSVFNELNAGFAEQPSDGEAMIGLASLGSQNGAARQYGTVVTSSVYAKGVDQESEDLLADNESPLPTELELVIDEFFAR